MNHLSEGSLTQIRCVFFDAAGTLIHLRESVGTTYSRLAVEHGVHASPEALDAAFKAVWKARQQPQHAGLRPEDGDRSWWAALVAECFSRALGHEVPDDVMKPLFTRLYDAFADAELWQVYPDVVPVLEHLKGQVSLRMLSNFDHRLHGILQGLGLMPYFDKVVVSSEVGYSKPHPGIFAAAVAQTPWKADKCLHVGDERLADFEGAVSAGLHAFHVQRPDSDLRELLALLGR